MSTLVPPPSAPRITRPRSGTDAASAVREPGRGSLSRAGVAGVGLRIGALAMGVGTGVLLARLLGSAELGRYETAMAWGALLGVPAGLGIEKLVVRETARARANDELSSARGLARAATLVVGCVSIALGIGVFALSRASSIALPAGMTIVACGVVPVVACMRVRQAIVQGLGRVIRGQVSELLVAPGAFLLAVVALALFMGDRFDATSALIAQVSAGVVALIAVIWFGRPASSEMSGDGERRYQWGGWLRVAAPFAGIAALQAINARADVVVLAALAGDSDVGCYAIANRVATLTTMALLAVNVAFAPTFAELHARGRQSDLERVAKRGARLALAFALPATLLFTSAGTMILSVFGPDFVRAADVLAVLSVAQLLNVAMGSVGLLLMMTGHSGLALRGLAVSAVSNVALNVALIPSLGAMGAAIASASSLLIWNLLLWSAVRRRLGIDASVLWRRR